jgi:hypothetical protein
MPNAHHYIVDELDLHTILSDRSPVACMLAVDPLPVDALDIIQQEL